MTTAAVPTPALSPETCAAYQALCSFCSWALFDDPAEDALRGLAAERAMFAEPPFSQVAPEAAAAFGALLAVLDESGARDDQGEAAGDQPDSAGGRPDSAGEQPRRIDSRPDPSAASGFLNEVRRDRSYLFYMVGASHASPYESVYRTDDHTMMGPATLEVRAAYRAHGLVFDRAATEPDDHVGLELAFAAHLLGQAAAGDAAALGACRDFLEEHLLTFAPTYLGILEERAHSAYYRCVACIAQSVLASLADALGARAVE